MNLTASEVLVQLDAIDAMELSLVAARNSVARSLRTLRLEAGLSLRDVAPSLGVTAQTVNNIERGKTWTAKTVRRLAVYYSKLSAA
jgi:DNA-binding XRE family transcriptional regulator